jgi:hypothetical protein
MLTGFLAAVLIAGTLSGSVEPGSGGGCYRTPCYPRYDRGYYGGCGGCGGYAPYAYRRCGVYDGCGGYRAYDGYDRHYSYRSYDEYAWWDDDHAQDDANNAHRPSHAPDTLEISKEGIPRTQAGFRNRLTAAETDWRWGGR